MALEFGKTVGCKGCDRIAEGVKHSDACHERFRKLLEDEAVATAAREKEKEKAFSKVGSEPRGFSLKVRLRLTKQSWMP